MSLFFPALGVLWGSLLIALAAAAIIFLLSMIISLIMTHIGLKMAEKDEARTAAEIKKLLPCTDCGRCDYDNCDQFARACAASTILTVFTIVTLIIYMKVAKNKEISM